jgi:F0F1-type ATP synthase membrane subunit b/b'
MSAFILNLLFLLAGGGSSDGWWGKVEPYVNYPGFEAWKFLNLGIFIAILVYLLKKPLSAAFKAKREAIRAELIKAEEEKQAALVKLTAIEAKLARLEAEKQEIIEKAKEEARQEKNRITKETQAEAKRLQAQVAGEIDRKTQQIKAQLRRFSAEESIRLAEEKLKARINAEKDAELVKAAVKAIGGLN